MSRRTNPRALTAGQHVIVHGIITWAVHESKILGTFELCLGSPPITICS
jgi:hypothetical protein